MSNPVFEDLFRLSRRRNRQSYFLFSLVAMVAGAVLLTIIAAAAASQNENASDVAFLATVPGWVALSITGWLVTAQRCRDFGWTGWAALLVLVPFIGWLIALAYFFVPGTVGENRYGPDPLDVFSGSGRLAAE